MANAIIKVTADICSVTFLVGYLCMCVFMALVCSTSDLSLGGVLDSRGEQQLSVLSSRQRSILDAVVVHLGPAVLPLKSDALVCQLNRLQVFGGIQVCNTKIVFFLQKSRYPNLN